MRRSQSRSVQVRSIFVLFGFYALLGFVDAAFGVNFDGLLKRHNLPPAALAWALLVGTAAALPLLWFGGHKLAQLPKRRALAAVGLLTPVAAWGLIGSSLPLTFLLSVVLLVVLTAALDGVANAAALDVEAASGEPVLGRVQAGLAVGAVAGAAAGGLAAGRELLPVLGVLIAVAGVALALGASTLSRRTAPHARQAARPRAGGAFVLIGAGAVGVYYVEGMLGSWAPLFLQREIGAAADVAGFVTSAYYVMFGLGAAASVLLVRRFGARVTLRVLSATGAAAAVMLGSAWSVWVAGAAMLLMGVSTAGIMPTLLRLGARSGLGCSASAYLTTFAYGGMLLEPLVVSVGGDSLRGAFWTLPVALVVTYGVTLARPRGAPVTAPAPAGD